MIDDENESCSICWSELTPNEIRFVQMLGGEMICESCREELDDLDIENTGHE